MTAPSRLFQGVFSTGRGDGSGSVSMGQGAGSAVIGSTDTEGLITRANYWVFTSQMQISKAFGLAESLDANNQLASIQSMRGCLYRIAMSEQDVTVVVAAMKQWRLIGHNPSPEPGVQFVNHWFGLNKIDDMEAFRKEYGDGFVSEMLIGGRYYGYYKFNSARTGSQKDILKQLNESLGAASGDLTANMASRIGDVARKHSNIVDCSHASIGTRGPHNDADMLDFALNFWSEHLESPEILWLATSPYEAAGFTH